jgi:hypothetical protein
MAVTCSGRVGGIGSRYISAIEHNPMRFLTRDPFRNRGHKL